jgi:hypothetical protein
MPFEGAGNETGENPSSKPGVQWRDSTSLDARLVSLEERLLAKMSKVEHHLDKKLNAILELLDKKRRSRSAGNGRSPGNDKLAPPATPEQLSSRQPNLGLSAGGELSNTGKGVAIESESESESDIGDASDGGASSSSAATSTYFESDDVNDDDSDFEKAPPVLVESDDWMINPRNQFRMTWDLCILFPFLMYLTIIMPFRMTFVNEAVTYSPV